MQAHASADAERQTSDHAISSKVGAAFFQLADFALTGVTSRDPKAVEPVDDQEKRVDDVLASVRSASVLGSACTGDSDVPSAIFPHAVVANIPVYSSDYSGIILKSFCFRSRGYSRIFFRFSRNYSLVFLLPIIPKLFPE